MKRVISISTLVLIAALIGLRAYADDDASKDQYAPDDKSLKVATFAGGCFWCVEGVFEQLKGVHDVTSGYTGGHVSPEALPVTYKQVYTGATGHAEAVRIVYDPK